MFAAPLIEQIPIAALTGVMFMVVIGTFEWSSFRMMRYVPKRDAFIIVLVSGVTVMTDLAVAVVVGVIVAALNFAWEHAKHIYATTRIEEDGTKVYEINGPLFFGSASNFKKLFKPKNDPDKVVIEFKNSRVADHSAIEAIDSLAMRYVNEGKEIHLRYLSKECRQLLTKAGDLCDVNVLEDPAYRVAVDKLA